MEVGRLRVRVSVSSAPSASTKATMFTQNGPRSSSPGTQSMLAKTSHALLLP